MALSLEQMQKNWDTKMIRNETLRGGRSSIQGYIDAGVDMSQMSGWKNDKLIKSNAAAWKAKYGEGYEVKHSIKPGTASAGWKSFMARNPYENRAGPDSPKAKASPPQGALARSAAKNTTTTVSTPKEPSRKAVSHVSKRMKQKSANRGAGIRT